MTPMVDPSSGETPSREDAEPSGLRRYMQTVLGHVRLIGACVIVTLVAAGAYVELAPRSYTADAQVLANPASSADTVLFSLPVLHSSGDPTQDVLTASALITTPAIAQAVIVALHLHESSSSVLAKVSAVPLDQSNIISVEATGSTPAQAASLANEFATQAIAVRTASLHKAIALILPGIATSVARQPAAERYGAGTLGDTLTQLQQLQQSSDPTISVSAQATLPTSPTSPRVSLSLAAGLFAGLLIGIGAAFAFDAFDPRVRREEQLHDRFAGVPVLARVPPSGGSSEAGPLTPLDLPAAALDQYRLLRAVLMARSQGPQAYLMTGSAPSEGKTTSAINLAAVMAQAGANVILIDADLRRPTIAKALGLTQGPWIEDVLSGEVPLARALAQVKIGTTSVLVLPAHGNSSYRAERLTLATARELVEDAKRLGAFVVIDAPPLTAVIEALPFARAVDEVLVAVRIGHSRLSHVAKLMELLAHQHVLPSGFVLVGVRERDGLGYHYYYEMEPENRPGAQEANGEPARAPRLPSGQTPSA